MNDDRIFEQAAHWHEASAGDDMDWDGFTSWLEADPRHRKAYDEIALTDVLVAEHASALQPRADTGEAVAAPPRRPWRRWAGGAIAAGLVALLALTQWPSEHTAIYRTDARSSEIALDDGSMITLAPRSRLEIRGGDQDRLALSGGAYFDIRHDPARNMTIAAGPLEVRDIGTRFDLQVDGQAVRLAIADGQVRVSGRALGEAVGVAAGQKLLFDPTGAPPRLGRIMPEAVGAWRLGTLDYQSAPLPLVVADLERYAGIRITLAEALDKRTFSGSLVIGNGKSAVRDLGQLMGLEVRADGDLYRLEPGSR